ncbi:MAG: hypothetical protein ACPGTP_06100 [Bacteroidia bacterium]
MKKILVLTMLAVMTFTISSMAQTKNELTLIISSLELKEQGSYQGMYRRTLKDNTLKFRAGLRLYANSSKETRSDTLSSQFGSFQYDVSIGIQKDLKIGDLDKVKLYTAFDGYLNSELRRNRLDTYYGYYWNFGFKPTLGIGYTPFENIMISVESRANANINLQDYSAPGVNHDRKFSLRPMDQVVLGLGYLF